MAKASSSGLSSDLAGGVDTIVARATPAGRGALALIRVSGPQAAACISRVCPDLCFDDSRRATLTTIIDAAGEQLDRAVAVAFPGPRSYTGEDMLEVTVHGSPYLVQSVIEAFVAAGARPAGAGEFTRRAVANGKFDLVQAEAIRDLVAADTAWQHRNAREQLSGVLSGEFRQLRDTLVALLAAVEASLDYEAQGVEVSTREISDLLGSARQQPCWRELRQENEFVADSGSPSWAHRTPGNPRFSINSVDQNGRSSLPTPEPRATSSRPSSTSAAWRC
jgi:tRNA U34 5-carboxymethylaminomethyl modifying GTPase MnmE/TrmE